MNALKLKAKIIESGMSMTEVAKVLKVNPATLYRKMNGDSEFTRREMETLIDLLNIEDVTSIFFN